MALFAIMAPMRRTKKIPGLSLRRISLFALALSLILMSQRAEARLLEIYGDVYLGGMYGTEPKFNSTVTQRPMGSQPTYGADFFHDQSGGLFGARAGIEIFYTDLYLQFDQFVTGNGLSGSTLQAMLGWDFGIGSGSWTGTIGGFGGLVFAFPYTPHWPIDSSQIAKVGAAAELQGGAEYSINRLLALQLMGTVGYHYMFALADAVPLGNGMSASTQTHGFHLLFKAGLRFHLGI
jgi:hypothetical protein